MAAFTLAHLSDPHLPPLPVPRLHELLSKRLFGYLNWTRNRQKYQRREVVDALLSDLHTERPDHIAVTGDFVNLALKAEFEPARAWLESVGPPDHVSIVPGNHDAYVRATRHRIGQCWSSYFTGDDTPDARFPYLRRRGPLALIGASSAVPTPPLMATGWLGQQQLDALEKLLHLIATEPLFRILLIHHPLRSKRAAKRLTDSEELLALLKRRGVDLVLHGHYHVHSTIWIDGPERSIPVVGVPSASALAHGHHPAAAYNLFSIASDGNAWRCEQTVRGLDDQGRISELKKVQLI
jgi:3',5'-cyclic AMP phosphodiesterase CpdA